MTHHFNLLASVPKAAPKAPSLPAAVAPGVLLLLGLTAAGTAGWNQFTQAGLSEQLRRLEQAAVTSPATPSAALDGKVLAALGDHAAEREALAAALQAQPAAESAEAQAETRASAWLEALDQTTPGGIALNQVSIEPGARLSLVGSALGAPEVNTLIEQLQKHALTGRAALGQLDIRRVDAIKDGTRDASGGGATPFNGLYFSITPPAPGVPEKAPAP